jgi:hypothetical protein
LLHHSTPLKFNRDSEDILPGQGDGISPLLQVSNRSKSGGERTHLFALGIGRDGNQQKGLERFADDRLCFRKLVP